MTHKLILKVKKFQRCNAKRFGTVEENLYGVDSTPPYHLELKLDRSSVLILCLSADSIFCATENKQNRKDKYSERRGE